MLMQVKERLVNRELRALQLNFSKCFTPLLRKRFFFLCKKTVKKVWVFFFKEFRLSTIASLLLCLLSSKASCQSGVQS